MAFTVGWPDGNSAVSVEYADGYFLDSGTVAWTGDDTAKQAALVRSTRYVKAWFQDRLDPLLFVDDGGNAITPEVFMDAVCEYALLELTTPGVLSTAPTVDASGYSLIKTKQKIGPLERDYAVAGGGTSGPMLRRPYPVPDALIAGLLRIAPYNRTTR